MSRKNRKIILIAEGAAIVVLLIVLLTFMHRSGTESSTGTAQGRAYIAAETAKDPAQAQAKIREAREAAQSAAAEEENADGQEYGDTQAAEGAEDLMAQVAQMNIRELSPEEIAVLRQRLDSAVVVGDSMAQAVYGYEFLDENHVMFQRSTSIGQLYDQTQAALAMLPDRIIFFTGLYDVDVFAEPEEYYNAYLERVNQVLAFDPDIQIYICSLLPPREDVGEWLENLTRSPQYDAQLQRLCEDTPAQYIDTNWMVRQELYLEDGIHFNYSFYTIWIQYVALIAGKE